MTDKALRYNKGKIKYTLAPAVWFREIAKICTKGAIKYTVTKEDGTVVPGDDNWMKSINTSDSKQFRIDRMDSIYRHLDDYREGRIYDPEVIPGAEHITTFTIAHVAWNCLALMFYDICEGVKDRFARDGEVGLHPENTLVGETSGCYAGGVNKIRDIPPVKTLKETEQEFFSTTPEEAKRLAERDLHGAIGGAKHAIEEGVRHALVSGIAEVAEKHGIPSTVDSKKRRLIAPHAGVLQPVLPLVPGEHVYKKGEIIAHVDASFSRTPIIAPVDCTLYSVNKNKDDKVIHTDELFVMLEVNTEEAEPVNA